jgi:hypothetical protein
LLALLANVAVFLFAFSPACTHAAQASPDTPIRATLDGMADAINPASALSAEACKARKEAITSRAEAQTLAKEAAKQLFEQAVERCKKLEHTFDQIKELHDQARMLVEHNELGEAKVKLAQLREAWRGIEDTPGQVTP